MAGGRAPAAGTHLPLGPPVGALSLGTSAVNLTPWVDVVKKSRARTLFMGKPDSKRKVWQLRQSGRSDSSTHTNRTRVDEMFSQVVTGLQQSSKCRPLLPLSGQHGGPGFYPNRTLTPAWHFCVTW